jgi:hypothetical protein
MPDWKQAADYKFTKGLDRNGWAWEFMRRNKNYQADFAKAAGGEMIYQPLKEKDETDTAWAARILKSGGNPRKEHITFLLGRKWRMISSIQNPDISNAPRFAGYPKRVPFDQVANYFEDDEPFSPIDTFALLVFDLSRTLSSQIKAADAQLNGFQKGMSLVDSRKLKPTMWATFLRLLDGEADGAKPKEIRKFIEAYHPKSKDPEDVKKATDKFSDHRKAAHIVRDDPRSILL